LTWGAGSGSLCSDVCEALLVCPARFAACDASVPLGALACREVTSETAQERQQAPASKHALQKWEP